MRLGAPSRAGALLAASALLAHGCASNPFSKVGGQAELPNELQKFEVVSDLPSPLPKPSQAPPSGGAAPPPEPRRASAAGGKKKRAAKKGAAAPLPPSSAGEPAPPAAAYPDRRPAKDPIWVGEESVYEVGYWPISAGDVFIETLPYKVINGRKVYHLRWRVVSSSALNLIYRVNDLLESYVDYEGLFSHRFHQVLDEAKQSKDAIEIHDPEKGQTFFWSRHSRPEGYVEKKEYVDTPRFSQDWVSALYYLRTLPFRLGEAIRFPLIFEGKVWEGIVVPERRETISTILGQQKAVVARIEPKIEGRVVGTARAWYSDDDRRVLLRLEVKVKIGAISFRLRQYQPGTDPAGGAPE